MQKAVGLLFLQSGILLRYVWKEGNVLKKVETTHFFMNQRAGGACVVPFTLAVHFLHRLSFYYYF